MIKIKSKLWMIVFSILVLLFVYMRIVEEHNNYDNTVVLIPNEQLPVDFSFQNYYVELDVPTEPENIYLDGEGDLLLKTDRKITVQVIRMRKK